ncbi:MAG: hypothetical protein HOP17_10555, partial [Acidobacteria bacterium]|nr:hypothetical protein [Acidobacteriota bacterium]
MIRCAFLFSLLFCFFAGLNAQTLAPGGPGKDAQWATAGKQAVGTSVSLESKVWFTLAQGVMTEVYYPDVTVANVHLLQFMVLNTKTHKVETEIDDSTGWIDPMYGQTLRFEQRNTAKSGEWEIRKTYFTDPTRNAIVLSVYFQAKSKDLKLFLYFDPSINNSGMHDNGWVEKNILHSSDGDTALAVIAQGGFGGIMANGFLGVNDGLTQLRSKGEIVGYEKAANGNIVQVADFAIRPKWDPKPRAWTMLVHIALGFGKSAADARNVAADSLKESLLKNWNAYDKGWENFLKTIPKVDRKYQPQFNMAAMQLKALEDKTARGANIASLSIP